MSKKLDLSRLSPATVAKLEASGAIVTKGGKAGGSADRSSGGGEQGTKPRPRPVRRAPAPLLKPKPVSAGSTQASADEPEWQPAGFESVAEETDAGNIAGDVVDQWDPKDLLEFDDAEMESQGSGGSRMVMSHVEVPVRRVRDPEPSVDEDLYQDDEEEDDEEPETAKAVRPRGRTLADLPEHERIGPNNPCWRCLEAPDAPKCEPIGGKYQLAWLAQLLSGYREFYPMHSVRTPKGKLCGRQTGGAASAGGTEERC